MLAMDSIAFSARRGMTILEDSWTILQSRTKGRTTDGRGAMKGTSAMAGDAKSGESRTTGESLRNVWPDGLRRTVPPSLSRGFSFIAVPPRPSRCTASTSPPSASWPRVARRSSRRGPLPVRPRPLLTLHGRLPAVGRVLGASKDGPTGLAPRLEPALVASVMVEAGPPPQPGASGVKALDVSPLEPACSTPWCSLVKSSTAPPTLRSHAARQARDCLSLPGGRPG